MNFVGHIHVAGIGRDHHGLTVPGATSTATESSAAWTRLLVGTALPDFAAIGRFQFDRQPDDPALRTGVAVHHATDGAFHSHPWFLATSKAVSSALRERGVNRGAARACGHVGVELLIDGHLLARSPSLAGAAQGVLNATVDRQLDLAALVDGVRGRDWRLHLERLASWTVPDDYHEPRSVARRLHRILSHRPRLALTADRIDDVAATLDEVVSPVIGGIDAMTNDVAADVTAEVPAPSEPERA